MDFIIYMFTLVTVESFPYTCGRGRGGILPSTVEPNQKSCCLNLEDAERSWMEYANRDWATIERGPVWLGHNRWKRNQWQQHCVILWQLSLLARTISYWARNHNVFDVVVLETPFLDSWACSGPVFPCARTAAAKSLELSFQCQYRCRTFILPWSTISMCWCGKIIDALWFEGVKAIEKSDYCEVAERKPRCYRMLMIWVVYEIQEESHLWGIIGTLFRAPKRE